MRYTQHANLCGKSSQEEATPFSKDENGFGMRSLIHTRLWLAFGDLNDDAV